VGAGNGVNTLWKAERSRPHRGPRSALTRCETSSRGAVYGGSGAGSTRAELTHKQRRLHGSQRTALIDNQAIDADEQTRSTVGVEREIRAQ
jgi:hypothetical protein